MYVIIYDGIYSSIEPAREGTERETYPTFTAAKVALLEWLRERRTDWDIAVREAHALRKSDVGGA